MLRNKKQTTELQIGGTIDEIEMQKMEIRKTHIICQEEPLEILIKGVYFQNLKIKLKNEIKN